MAVKAIACEIPPVSDEVQKEIKACRAQLHTTLCFWSADTAQKRERTTGRGDLPTLASDRPSMPVVS